MRQILTQLGSRKKFLQPLFTFFLCLLLGVGLIAAPANATGVYDLPDLGSSSSIWIVDRADVISRANEGKLTSNLRELAEQTGNEVRMVVIRRLDYGETIDSFAEQLFNKWFPTPEEQANQTLLVIDTLTNKSTIRTGDTVKSVMAEEIAQSVASETVQAPLRQGGKYNQALLNASDRLVAVLSGQPDPGPPNLEEINIESTYNTAEETDDRSATIWVVVILVVATVIPMVTYFWYVGFPGN